MGEEHYTGRTTWVSTLLVVVSTRRIIIEGNTASVFRDKIIIVKFLFSVFWDLYCAAPERRDSCEHSSEAKAFHDYVIILTAIILFCTSHTIIIDF
jgi:hypothetical protein